MVAQSRDSTVRVYARTHARDSRRKLYDEPWNYLTRDISHESYPHRSVQPRAEADVEYVRANAAALGARNRIPDSFRLPFGTAGPQGSCRIHASTRVQTGGSFAEDHEDRSRGPDLVIERYIVRVPCVFQRKGRGFLGNG